MRTGAETQTLCAHGKHSCSQTASNLLRRAWQLPSGAELIHPSHNLHSQLNIDTWIRVFLLCRWVLMAESHQLSTLPSPFPYLSMPSLSCRREGPAPRKRHSPLPLLQDKGTHRQFLWSSGHITSSHPAYLALACFVHLKWAEGEAYQPVLLCSTLLN